MPVIACCEAHDITTGTTQFVKTSDAYLERRAQQRRSASPARIMGRRDDHHQLEEGCELMQRLSASINRRGASPPRLNHDVHAIATPSSLDPVGTAARSPRNDFATDHRVHATHRLMYAQARLAQAAQGGDVR